MEPGFLAAVDILVNRYLPESEFARKSAPNQLGLFGEDELAAAVAPKSRTRNLRKPAKGQMSFNWDEESHPRESESHDGKRPGEFAPNEHAETAAKVAEMYPSLKDDVKPEEEEQPEPVVTRDNHTSHVWDKMNEAWDGGKTLAVTTRTRSTPISPDNRGMMRFHSGQIQLQRKDSWDTVTGETLDHLAKQAGTMAAIEVPLTPEEEAAAEARSQKLIDDEAASDAKWQGFVGKHFGGDYGNAMDEMDATGIHDADEFIAHKEKAAAADDLESLLQAIEAVPENEDEKNEIRRMKGWTQERIDAYDPLSHVRKLTGGGWIATGIEGTDWPTVFKTKKSAVEMTERHKKLKQDQFNNPTGYANLTSIKAEKNLALIDKYMKQGMSEMDAGKKAREDEAAGYPEPQPNPVSNATPQNPPQKKSTLADAIAASNKKNAPEGGWTDADRVPGSYSDSPKADITEQFPSLKGFTEEPKPAEPEPPKEQAFDPEKDGGYKPLLQLANDIKSGKLSLEQYKEKHAFFRKHGDEFLADLNKRFNATQMKNVASNFGDWSANRNTKGENAKSIYQKLMSNAFLLAGGLQIDYLGGENYDTALDKHVDKQTGESFAKYQQAAAGKAAEAVKENDADKEAIENPKTLEDFRKAIRHHGGYDKLPDDKQAAYDDLQATSRREESTKSKAKVTGFSGGTEATGATSIVEGHHQKRNAPTYTVTVEKHLGDGWGDALSRAKQLGGSYVNGRIAKAYHATPGFQFFNRADAEKFQKSLGGEEVDRSDRLDEKNIARMDNASERLAALSEATKKRAEEKLNAPRQTNTHRRAEHAAGAQAQARSEAAKAETMKRISEGLASGSLKHLGGIRARTHVDTLDSLLHNAKLNAWRDSKSTSQDSYEEMRERDATSQDISKAKYPYPRIWDHELAEHLDELSQIPGLKNIARDLKRSTEKSPYKKKIGKISINGGEAKTADQLSDIPMARGLVKDKAVRIHVSQDPTLLKGRHPIAYTADGGKTWGTTQDIAVSAAVHGEVNGTSKLDLIDPPQHEQVEIKDPDTIASIQKAIKILKRKSNPRLKRVAESLGQHMEDYNRLQGMDITTPMELRAALREYAPLKKRQDKEDPVKAKERSIVGRKIDGFFPTPRPAIDKMLAAADIQPGMSVLEPSAGKGDILDAVKEQHPDAKTIGIETNSDLRDLIGMKGHELHDDTDFLQHNGQYDRIVMNPPFENRADVSHVQHAFKNIKPGGRLVAIMGAGVFGGSSKKDQEFRDWLDEHGGEVEDMPEGSFSGADAFRKTGVNTRMVVIDKPHDTKQFSRDLAFVLSRI